MKSDIVVTVNAEGAAAMGSKIQFIQNFAVAGSIPVEPPLPDPVEPVEPPVPPPPPERRPRFRVGKASGKPGETVEVPVYGWCSYPISGFHIGGGCGTLGVGYVWDVTAQYSTLSPFLQDYLPSTAFTKFQSAGAEQGAIPEAWWEYAVGFWSMDGTSRPEIPIPSGTELFRVALKIDEQAPPGLRTLTCRDNHYYTNDDHFRRNFEYTHEPRPYTNVECLPGELTILEP